MPPAPTPQPQPAKLPIEGVKNLVAVASGKGGVGKTTVAVNLALALRRLGASVGLLDADVYGPNVPIMLGTDEQPQALSDRQILPVEAQGVKLISMGLLNTGDVQLSLIQMVPVTGAVLVTTPSVVALADVRKAIEMFRQVNVDIIGIVENMSFFNCPHCQGRIDVFGHGEGRRIAGRRSRLRRPDRLISFEQAVRRPRLTVNVRTDGTSVAQARVLVPPSTSVLT